MHNDLGLLVKDIPQDDLELFLKNTKSTTDVKRVADKVEVDYSWVDILDESVPYLDTIIRNPRRFIVAEEDVIPIEKTKRVSEESIKHLAVHTNLIQDVDEDGLVKPLKLLNVFKEETIDLYENRFIYSLITNLYAFVREQLTYKEQSVKNKEQKSVKYTAVTTYKDQEVNISLDMTSRNLNEEEINEELVSERNQKIEHIKEILEDFMASKFMKAMANATPVRSPIRKTNVILKEQNFMKAVELWEFLERYQIENPVKEISAEEDLTNRTFEKGFDLTYFLNFGVLNELVTNSGSLTLPETASLERSIYEYARKFETDEVAFRKEINNIITEAISYKKEQKTNAINAYNSFVENHKKRMYKACLLFK